MTWVCHECRWRYPETVRSEALWWRGKSQAVCCLCIPINPNRLSAAARRDFASGQRQARDARRDGSAIPPADE